MTTTAQEAARRVNKGYIDVYLKRRLPDGTYEADWQDIGRYVELDSVGSLRYELESEDFDVGVFMVSNVSLSLINKEGRFSDVRDSRSLWAAFETRNLSKVKIEAGYRDPTDAKIASTVFNGIWDDRTVRQGHGDSITVNVLALEALFRTVTVVPGTLSSSVLASTAFEVLCSRGEITDHITVAAANINPATDVTIDTPSAFANRRLDDVLQELALATNSVVYIDESLNLVVRARTNTAKVQHRLYANSDTGATDNVYGVSSYNAGHQRVKNYWTWSSTTLVAKSEDRYLRRFGTTLKSVSLASVTTTATRQAILDALLAEWQFPKRELEVTTDYLGDTPSFYDLVTVDVRPSYAGNLDDLPVAGSAVAGTAVASGYASGLLIEKELGFKVIGWEHDLQNFTTTLKLREKGTGLNDGWITSMATKNYDVAFAAETSKDIDVSVWGMDAQKCVVEVVDEDNSYVTSDFMVERPTTATIRLRVGVAITGNYRVLIVETED